MERSVLDITLDLQRPCCPGTITVTRGDTHRTLRFYLSDGGRPYPVDGLRAVLTATKPDGTYLFNDCALEGDRIVYHLTPQTTVCPGLIECQLRLYGGAGELLHTAAFTLIVEDTVYSGDETITSTGEVTALTKLVTEADEKMQQMEAVLKNEANHAVLDDSRVGSNTWSSQNLLDKLCPAFTAEGAMAVCAPVEGYPLEVVSTVTPQENPGQTLQLHQVGKNLCSLNREIVVMQNAYLKLERPIPAGSYFISGDYTGGGPNKPVVVPVYEDGKNSGTYLQYSYWPENGRPITFEKPVTHLRVYTNGYSHATSAGISCTIYDLQIEAGSKRTAYEPYIGKTLTVDFTKAPALTGTGRYHWNTGILQDESAAYLQDPATGEFLPLEDPTADSTTRQSIPAFSGTNCFYSNCGTTTVTGKIDIRPLLTKLLEV